jgi:hypothetical protein
MSVVVSSMQTTVAITDTGSSRNPETGPPPPGHRPLVTALVSALYGT